VRRFSALVLISVLALAACSSSSGSAAPKATGTGSTATQAAGDPGTTANAATEAPAVDSGECIGTSQAGTWDGKTTATYCGNASASITIGGTKFEIKGGQCVYAESVGFAVNLGTSVTGVGEVPAGGPQYLGVVDTSGTGAMATGFVGGYTILVSDGSSGDSVKIAADHKSGSISGSTLTGETLTATFTC
jgi:predicted RNA-binding protein with TRAM domain